MKKYIESYKSQFNYFINNKRYIICIILVTLLSFGFAISHISIGMDDTCLDRYYGAINLENPNNMISSGRWGSYLLYKILGITSFTPFWLDLIVIVIHILTALLIVCFIRKNIKKEVSIYIYILFSSIYISYPLINEVFIFQPSNLAVALGTFLTMTSLIIIYENYINKVKNISYLNVVLIMAFSISLYESCCQTFLVGIFTIILFDVINNKNFKNKDIYIITLKSILVLLLSIIINYTVLFIFFYFGVSENTNKLNSIYWKEYGIFNGIKRLNSILIFYTLENIQYFPVLIFTFSLIVGFIISTIYSYKRNNAYIIILYILIVISNFSLSILQCEPILYRTCSSWGLFVSAVLTTSSLTIYYNFKNKLKIPLIIISILLILWQTRDLNQWFYSDYIKYQRDLQEAFSIAINIQKETSHNKPICFVGTPEKGFQIEGKKGAQSNGISVIWWGKKAFDDNANELINFINSLGYSFTRPTKEQYIKGEKLSENMNRYPKEGYIKEFDDIIVVKF